MGWDVFISHASEDKDIFVRELANRLSEFGLKVWYDEFELKVGDSLIKSINKGLLNSNFGIVILSPAFFEKGWTDYELTSLLNVGIHNQNQHILPIWHNINADNVANKFPYLMDLYALSSDESLEKLCYKIVEVVKPSLINSSNIIDEFRKMNFSKIEKIDISALKIHDIQHEALPSCTVVGCNMICSILQEVFDFSLAEFCENLSRDSDYNHEFALWTCIAITYNDFVIKYKISDLKIKKDVALFLLKLLMCNESMDDYISNYSLLSKDEYVDLYVSFVENHDRVGTFMGEKYLSTYPNIIS